MRIDKSKNGGITLIALILTVIVMLILAGITLLALVGDNGILEQAISSSEETDIADTYDQIQLTLVGYYDEQGKYTEANVWEAVDAVLGSDAERNTTAYTVQTEKGNTVDLSALIDGASDKKYKIYVGYYADVDNDGNVDGVIYADLVTSLDISYDGIDDFHIDSVDEDKLKQYKISDDYYERNIRNSKSY